MEKRETRSVAWCVLPLAALVGLAVLLVAGPTAAAEGPWQAEATTILVPRDAGVTTIEVKDDFEDGVLDPEIWWVHGFDEPGYRSRYWEQNGCLETRFVRCDDWLSAIYHPLAPEMQDYEFSIDFTLVWSGYYMDSKFGYRTLGDFDDPISNTDIPGPSWPESGFFVWAGYGNLLRIYAFMDDATVMADEYTGDTTLVPGYAYRVKFEMTREGDTLDMEIMVLAGETLVVKRETSFLLTAESYVPEIFSIWGRLQGGTWHNDCRALMLRFDNLIGEQKP
jgi:hypothetical protein